VPVFIPIGGVNMKFNISNQDGIVNFNSGFKKIRSLVGIISARMNDLQYSTITNGQIMPVKILKLPDKLEKSFSHEDKVYVKKSW